jgi:origin recognition complex subunit 4
VSPLCSQLRQQQSHAFILGTDSQRLIFIIEEFDLFCAHHNQTLLYNLFDVAQSAQTPICVLGITHRLDVIELLEKRVKSRFSHRQIFLLPNSDDFDGYVNVFKKLLKLPSAQESAEYTKKKLSIPKSVFKEVKLPFIRRLFNPSDYQFSKKHVTDWNKSIDQLAKKDRVASALENLYNTSVSLATLKLFLFQIVSKLSDTHPKIEDNDVIRLVEHLLFEDSKVKLMTGLSVLEICILIAIKHHCEIYDNDPFNFEIVLTRYNKFAFKSSTMQNIDREVILKAFENLKVCTFTTHPYFYAHFKFICSIKSSSDRSGWKENFRKSIRCTSSSSLQTKLKRPFKSIRTCRQKLITGPRVQSSNRHHAHFFVIYNCHPHFCFIYR